MNNVELQAAIQKIASDLEAGFRSVIPQATLRTLVDVPSERWGQVTPSVLLSYTLLERDQYPFNIARNDPAFINVYVEMEGGNLVAKVRDNSIYVNPKVAYLALSRESVGLRNGKIAKNDAKLFGVKTAQKIKDAILKHKEDIFRDVESRENIDAAIAKLEAL